MPQASQRGRNQEGMQPVGVILHAVEVVTGSHPRRLVPPQAHTIRGKVPLQRHGPYGQARAVGGAVPRAPGVEPPVLGVAPPSDGMGGAVGRRTTHRPACSRSDGDTAAPPSGPPARCGATASTRPRAAGAAHTAVWSLPERPARLCRGPGGATGPPRAFSSAGPRGEQHRTTLLVGKRRRHACRVAAQPSVQTERAWESGASAVASLAHAPSPRATGPVSAASTTLPPRKQPPPTVVGTETGGVAPRVRGSSAPRSRGPVVRVLHGGAPQRRAAKGQPGPLPAQGSAATDGGQGVTRPPPRPPGAGCVARLGARQHGGHAARGAQGQDGPRGEPGAPAHEQRLFDRHVAVVPGKTLGHLVRTQCRVLAQPLGQRLPRLGRVVDRLALLPGTRTRHTERLYGPGMVLLGLLLGGMTLYTVWRHQGNHPHGCSAGMPPTTKSGGIRFFLSVSSCV